MLLAACLERLPSATRVTVGSSDTIQDREELLGQLRAKLPRIAHELPTTTPAYITEGLRWASSNGSKLEWWLRAKTSATFPQDVRIFAQSVVMDQLDGEGADAPHTVVSGDEAIHDPDHGRLDLFGNVQVRLSDGFLIKSEFAHYFTESGTYLVPPPFEGTGEGTLDNGQHLFFRATGLIYRPETQEMLLLLASHVELDETLIESDQALFLRTDHKAEFWAHHYRPPKKRWVSIRKPDLWVQSRTAEFLYGKSVVKVLIAHQDVTLEDRSQIDAVRYGTCGRALFDRELDQIDLTEYPQVYQGQDTVTGEWIRMKRKQNIVEVERSNAFSESQ